MVNSNVISEPGYYEDGEFGIRHENMAMVVPAETKVGMRISSVVWENMVY